MPAHTGNPKTSSPDYGVNGAPPLSKKTSSLFLRQLYYLAYYRQVGQLYTYSGPGPHPDDTDQLPNPNYSYSSASPYYVILHSQTKADTANPTRQLGGAILPWSYKYYGSSDYPKITWTPSGGSPTTLWSTTATLNDEADTDVFSMNTQLSRNTAIDFHDGMEYSPGGAGLFTFGTLNLYRMRAAALSLFSLPDLDLTDAEARVLAGHVSAGQGIRGYTGTGTPSLGDLIHLTGYEGDSAEHNTRRCILQSGHPAGINVLGSRDGTSYINLRGGNNSYFRIRPRDLKNSGTVKVIPAIYTSSPDGTADVEFYCPSTTDTCVINVTSGGLHYNSSGLTVDANGNDKIRIRMRVNGSGHAVTLYTYSLWEDDLV